jgi:flagellar basal-body rod protein FlgB
VVPDLLAVWQAAGRIRADPGEHAAVQGVAMLFNDIVNSESIPAMEKMLAYTQARHQMLVDNIANVDTPGYKTKQLDTRAFQKSLREALDERSGTRTPHLRGRQEFRQDASGYLEVTPTEEPAENILFHDQTNMRIEKQMSMLAENTLMHQVMAERLRGKFGDLMAAIRGQV